MKIFLILALVMSFSSPLWAGNGVERGSVMINTSSEINSEIQNYLGKELRKCSDSKKKNSFSIMSISLRRHKVDQGITDLYYRIHLIHQDHAGRYLNDLTIEVLDSDFHNWRQYEEKLSMEIINDQNNMCNYTTI